MLGLHRPRCAVLNRTYCSGLSTKVRTCSIRPLLAVDGTLNARRAAMSARAQGHRRAAVTVPQKGWVAAALLTKAAEDLTKYT